MNLNEIETRLSAIKDEIMVEGADVEALSKDTEELMEQ